MSQNIAIYSDLWNGRYDRQTGEAAALRHGGRVVSRRVDLLGVEMTTYAVPYDNSRGELLYVWRSGPHGYEWQTV